MSHYTFRLFVAGHTVQSEQALSNLRRLCNQHLGEEPDIELIDVLRDPSKAEEDKILATPTLIKISPQPVRRVIGDLSKTDLVLLALDIPVESK